MILLKFEEAIRFQPTPWTPGSSTGSGGGYSMVSFQGNHPDNPEYGIAEFTAQLLEGQFNDITEIIVIGQDNIPGRIISWGQETSGDYHLKVQFDTVFRQGLEYCLQQFVFDNCHILGLSPNDKAALTDIDGQRELLKLLASFMLPSKSTEIPAFAQPCLLLIPNDNSDEKKSHYLGTPKHDAEFREKYNPDGHLLHLATLFLSDFTDTEYQLNGKKHLSFYINPEHNDTEDMENSADNFRVITYDDLASAGQYDEDDFDPAVNFTTRRFLDLPGYDHSLLHHLNFTLEEREQYDTLLLVYKELTIGDMNSEEVNKLLGYPDSIQNCVSYEAERISSGRDYSDDIYKDAVNWQLLFQVSPYCKWFSFFDDFGDSTIYFMIKKDDLVAGNFEHCLMIAQCT